MPPGIGYGGISRRKAGEMLEHGEVRGKPLTPKQRGLFGLIRGGQRPTRTRELLNRVKGRFF